MTGSRRTLLAIVALAALLASVALVLTSCGSREPRLIPRSVVFGNPERMRARISPDGESLAYVAPSNDVLNVWVGEIGGSDFKPVTHDTDRGVYDYFWAEDGEHILYLQDAGGDENWRLYAVNLETGDTRDLTPFDGVRVEVLEHTKRFPNTIIVSMNKQDPRLFDVYRLELDSGDLTMVARNPGNVIGWLIDSELKVRGSVVALPDGTIEFLVRDTEDSVWTSVASWGSEDNMTSAPIAFTLDGDAVLMIDSRNANTGRLVRLDLESGETEVLAEDHVYDVSDVMINPDTREVEAVAFNRDRVEWENVAPSVEDDFDAISGLDEGTYGVYSRDNADKTWLVAFTKDDGPITYYAFDRDSNEGTFLFDHRSELNSYTLARMEPFSFSARDGLTIHGYLTYPPGGGRTGLPMVLNVHGGPWARDEWGYNPEAQWLANRGYLCMQVNFRGSTGYGKEFVNAGDKEWGNKMQHDLVDAVEWAVEQGIADPERVAIYGGSYGGYASLVGATFTPDLFACAVATMGPSNLITWIESVPPYWTTMLEIMYKRVGDPRTEADMLKERSPIFRVNEIRIPLLIAHGANDPRVKQEESEQIVAAMQEKGIDVEYMLFPDEGHGFAKPENRLKFYAATEDFFARYLGGRSEVEATN